jgi:hypothetical protein
MFPQKLATRLRDRLVQSRFFTISITLHTVLLLVLATIVWVKPSPPPEIGMTAIGKSFVEDSAPPIETPQVPVASVPPQLDVTRTSTGVTGAGVAETPFKPITTVKEGSFISNPGFGSAPTIPSDEVVVRPGPGVTPDLTKAQLNEIKALRDYRVGDRSSNGVYEFTAYIGRYNGNWNSTVRVSGGEITAGSLPNLLYVTSKWTKNKIRTNERNVKALALDSDEIFTTRPPFILLTGTRDFKLTDKEIDNLRKYIRLGGAIWGDSSVPGERSAFDNAFVREMKRVLGDSVAFEALPEDHPVLAKGYFPKVKALPSGINHYNEPVRVMRWGGEIAVIQTRNDYGDMWQIGLDEDGKIDLSKNIHGQYVAMNDQLWSNRGTYIRNVEQPAVEQAYKFGINMIFHLITRWESRTSNSAPL